VSALTVYGRILSLEQVFSIVERDLVFYRQSGGGMTLSGGEPLAHAEFSAALLKQCRRAGIHTCVETSGFGSRGAVEAIAPYADLFYLDWKASGEEDAKKYLSVSNRPMLDTLELLMGIGAKILLRCPIVPDVNDHAAHFDSILHLLDTYPSLLGAELLPYHDYGVAKRANIGEEALRFRIPAEAQKAEWMGYFRARGCARARLA
jgi:pyruvate formate lyase activating enzyme